ncbi:MAG: hypothetical protein HYU63_01375 [Armatimonadetes bacterium]|nr:hypothetical protein [Armatimonadota bacterium]
MKKKLPLFLFLLSLVLFSCARGPSSGSGTSSANQARYLSFTITVNNNGRIDQSGIGHYFVLFSSNTQGLINVADNRTYTDYVRYDGVNANWYHRRKDPQNPNSFIWEFVGGVNNNLIISGDEKSLTLNFNINDSSILLNQYLDDYFNAHVVITDASDRPIDTLGQGPNFINNSAYTLYINKQQGIISPVPSIYPNDSLNDTLSHPENPSDYPYVNFDLKSFQVLAY